MPDEVLWAVSILATRKTSGGVLDLTHTVAILRAADEAEATTQALEQARRDWPPSQGWSDWHAAVCTVLPPAPPVTPI